MRKGLNFKTMESQNDYIKQYDETLSLISIPIQEIYVTTQYGDTHVLCCGDKMKPPLILLHAASCSSLIWYKNLEALHNDFCIYAIDLIGETSKSILTSKMKTQNDHARWLDETLETLQLEEVYVCGLSIGGWYAANYAGFFPEKINKLILLSPVQTFAKMYRSYFIKIMKMGFHPTRKNVENYIGWGSEKEDALPDSIIALFVLSVMNMNANISFPKWLNKKQLRKLKMPVLLMFGEQEFAFSTVKAKRRAEATIEHLYLENVQGASHLLPVSRPDYLNKKMKAFLYDETS